ncbi:MAG: cytochrome c-type biogenesis protein [Mizugakiibacter sp.]|uniref:cytochrome c-type biogenesis protein n=1 Tax=Mizugakiibacter sp. TaxID=1972610 RepID=UPI0031BD8EBB|nr:cytochrome c-type biogenesis protein CcmH [Xanthomonadaceae bacterium]
MKRALRIGLLLAALLVSASAFAIDPLPFKDAQQRERFQHLTSQLRCLVCQNESLNDSNADLAKDLRHEVFQLMQQGKSDDEIKQYLVARYSDFVLYDPPLRASTVLLWFGPALVLLGGAAVVVLTVRRRGKSGTAEAPAAEEEW